MILFYTDNTFGGHFYFALSTFEIRKTIFNNEMQDALSSSCDICGPHHSTGLWWRLLRVPGHQGQGPGDPQQEAMAGADPEQPQDRGLGAGGAADPGAVPNLTWKT